MWVTKLLISPVKKYLYLLIRMGLSIIGYSRSLLPGGDKSAINISVIYRKQS